MATLPLTTGGISSFIPEIWAAELLHALKMNLVFAQPTVVNRDYEGEIANQGDTVHIGSLTDPTIGTYSTHTDITLQALTTSDQTLTIDQAKYFAFEVDDIEYRQSRNGGALMSEAADRSAYGLAVVADQFVAGLIKAGAGNTGTAITTVDTTGAAYELMFRNAMKVLDQNNVPRAGRYAVVSPAVNAQLLGSSHFVTVNESGTETGLRNGMVQRGYGFDILMSNDVPTGTTYPLAIFGHPMAVAYAEQISKVEAYRPQARFSDALKGLHLYGAKVVRPTALYTVEANA